MSALIERTGKHRQRYENDFRLDDAVDCESTLELLMVSSPDREDLVFLGGWEDDETIGEATCRSSLKEAGVKGILD
ncbi:hypothetical protein MKX03_005846, partial [Papaver bracteatum]